MVASQLSDSDHSPASDTRLATLARRGSTLVEAAPCPDVCDLERPTGTSIWAFAAVLEHDGIPVAEFKARRTHTLEENGERVPEDETTTTLVDVLSYGGWLDHTEFRVSFARSCVVGVAGCSETDPEFEVAHVQGFAAGVYSGTTPTGMGSATWTGVMIGMESPEPGSDEVSALLRNGQPDVFLGDARIMIDDLAVHHPIPPCSTECQKHSETSAFNAGDGAALTNHVARCGLSGEHARAQHEDFDIGLRPFATVESLHRKLEEQLVRGPVALPSGVFEAFPLLGTDSNVLLQRPCRLSCCPS